MKKALFHFAKLYQWVIQPLLVVVILLFGYFSAKGLTLFKQELPQNQVADYAPLVKVLKTSLENKTLMILGNGTIEARTRIKIVPQVGGRVVYIHPQLRAGGYFKSGQTLIKIETIDFQLAVTSAASEVASAKRNQQLEIAEAAAAIEEWQALQGNKPVPILVKREPQIAEAQANLQAAKARLQLAKINLNRTRISMPFDGRVVEASVDVGEVLSANQTMGIVYSSDIFEIPVPVEVDQLTWLNFKPETVIDKKNSQQKAKEKFSSAEILITLAGQNYTLIGQIVRVESELDIVSRLARVVISLKATEIPESLREEVIPGLFVDVKLTAREIEQITVLPRRVLRENGILWIAKNNKLSYLTPQIIYQSDNRLWIKNMPVGTEVITSSLEVVTEGMQVRLQELP